MPGHQNDHFDDFDDDEDEGFMTFDARGGEEEGMSRGPIIMAALVLLAAIVLAITWVYFNGNKIKQDATPEIASQTETFKEVPINAVAATGEDIDKSVYNSVEGAAPPALEVQAEGPSQEPLVPANQVAAPATKPVVSKPVAIAPKPATTTPAAPKVAVAAPKPAVAAPKPAASAPAPKPVVAASTPSPAPKPVAAAPKPASSGAASAQLGSFPTKAQADAALASYRAKGFKGNASIIAADLGAKGTWYRVRATGFGSRDEAVAFCAKAKSAGAACAPAN